MITINIKDLTPTQAHALKEWILIFRMLDIGEPTDSHAKIMYDRLVCDMHTLERDIITTTTTTTTTTTRV